MVSVRSIHNQLSFISLLLWLVIVVRCSGKGVDSVAIDSVDDAIYDDYGGGDRETNVLPQQQQKIGTEGSRNTNNNHVQGNGNDDESAALYWKESCASDADGQERQHQQCDWNDNDIVTTTRSDTNDDSVNKNNQAFATLRHGNFLQGRDDDSEDDSYHLQPGELSPILWRNDRKHVSKTAYRIGLPPELSQAFVRFLQEDAQLLEKMKMLSSSSQLPDGQIQLLEVSPQDIESNTTSSLSSSSSSSSSSSRSSSFPSLLWYAQKAPMKWNSDLRWYYPADEFSNEQYQQLLLFNPKTRFREIVLESIGNYFQLHNGDGLVAFNLAFFTVSHCTNGYIHRGSTNTDNKTWNLVIPLGFISTTTTNTTADIELLLQDQSSCTSLGELILQDDTDKERRGVIHYEPNVGILLGDDAYHATSSCDYRRQNKFRIAAILHIADVNESNAKEIARSTLFQPFPNDVGWLLSQRMRNWKPNSSGDNDNHHCHYVPPGDVIPENKCLEYQISGLCETSHQVRQKCPASCGVYLPPKVPCFTCRPGTATQVEQTDHRQVPKSRNDKVDKMEIYENINRYHASLSLQQLWETKLYGWYKTPSQLKELLRPWKMLLGKAATEGNNNKGNSNITSISKNAIEDFTIYESACGNGMNLRLTSEILQEEFRIPLMTVYGNDYLQSSIDIARTDDFWQTSSNNHNRGNSNIDGKFHGIIRKGQFCSSDSTQLDFVPSSSFDIAFTGYIDPILDPLGLFSSSLSKEELGRNSIELCHMNATLASMAQKLQEDWYSNWILEMIRITKPGKVVAIESISESTCKARMWGGVDKDWWIKAVSIYQWDVDPNSIVLWDVPWRGSNRYHVLMKKNDDSCH